MTFAAYASDRSDSHAREQLARQADRRISLAPTSRSTRSCFNLNQREQATAGPSADLMVVHR